MKKNNIEMWDVNSSNVVAVGWNENNLYVDYKRGSYVYKNVPESTFDHLLSAESKGKFMNTNVKGKYDYEYIG